MQHNLSPHPSTALAELKVSANRVRRRFAAGACLPKQAIELEIRKINKLSLIIYKHVGLSLCLSILNYVMEAKLLS